MTEHDNIEYLGLSNTKNPAKLTLIDLHISAGFPSPAVDYEEKEFDLNDLIEFPNRTHIMRISGDSMEPLIADCSILIVKCGDVPLHNDIVVAQVNGNLVCKYYYDKLGEKQLRSENRDYDPILFQDGDELIVFGVVTCHFYEHKKCLA